MFLYTLLSTVLLAVLLPVVYATVRTSLNQTLLARLQTASASAFSATEISGNQLFTNAAELDSISSTAISISSSDGQTLYEKSGSTWLTSLSATDGVSTYSYNNEKWEVLSQQYEINDNKFTVRTASKTDYVDESLENLIKFLLALIPVYLLLSALGSYLLAKRALQPVRRISETARAIGSGDLTQRIQNVQSNDEVGELAATFNGMLDDLEVSFRRERQFTSDASHELRTPLAVISACTEDAESSESKQEITEDLKAIQTESGKMKQIISQLLTLSRGYEGRSNFEPEEIELAAMANSVTEELKNDAAAKNITLHNEIAAAVKVTADQSLMTQLFINIISNAIKYGKQNGDVWIRAEHKNNSTVITFQDNGIGISSEDQKHIFERFYRADQARDRSGSGLGLAIVQWIVEMHHGSISVKSNLNQGSTFTVIIPDAAALLAAQPAAHRN